MLKLNRMLKNSTMLIATIGIATQLHGAPHALTVRDDVTIEGSEALADNPDYDGAVQIYLWDPSGAVFFNCSGSLMNHRTVITAAHCFNFAPSSSYGDVRDGLTTTPIIAYGPDTFVALNNWIATGEQVVDARNGLTFGNQVLVHPDAEFGGLAFPAADITMVSLADPLDQIPSYSVLFSPAPAGSHVLQVAYGNDGTGTGGLVDIEGKRQAGENILGLVGSQDDFVAGVFNDETATFGVIGASQSFYWIDFDNPDRVGDECERDTATNSFTCDGAATTLFFGGANYAPSIDIDQFPGDALPNEAGTAPGDSGSALFFDELSDQLLIGGVLSGGFNFTTPIPSGYGDVSYYNPLFNFHQFVSETNPLKYVGANAGDGNWSDPTHWTQLLDPGYFIIDENGNVVNGLPDGDEEGVADTTPTDGVVLDVDLTESAATGTLSADASPTHDRADAQVTTASGDELIVSESVSRTSGRTGTPELVTFLGGDIGTAGPASGPGATGFVPNNGVNADGFINYFDVTLSQAGTTTADVDATVDRLTISNPAATLTVATPTTLTAILDTRVTAGTLDVDGTLASRDVLNFGMLRGAGTISADSVWNGGMLLTEGLSIDGDLILTSAGVLIFNGQPISVDGDVSLGGGFVAPGAGFGASGTLINYTGSSVGTFADTDLPGVLFARVSDTGSVVAFEIDATSFAAELGSGASAGALLGGSLLDGDRASNFNELSEIYAIVDTLEGPALASALESLVPVSGSTIGLTSLVGSESLTAQLGARIGQIVNGNADGVTTNGAGGLGGLGLGSTTMAAELGTLMSNAATAADAPQGHSSNGRGLFLRYTYQDGQADAAFGSSGHVQGYTVTAGGDINVTPDARIGAFVSYADGDNDFNINIGTTDSEAINVGVYGVADLSGTHLSGYLGAGQRDITTVRGALGSAVSGDTSSDEILVGAAVSRAYQVGSGAAIAPVISADYYSYEIDGYTETGGIGALEIDGRDASSLQLGIGADAHLYDTRKGAKAKFRPVVGASYVMDVDGEQDPLVGRLVSGTQNLVLNPPSTDKNWLELRGAATWVTDGGLQASVFLERTVGRTDLEYTSVGIAGRIRF